MKTIQGKLQIQNFSGGISVRILNCENAGKRGKTCEEMSISIGNCDWSQRAQLMCDLAHNMEIKLENVDTWEKALAFAELAKTTLNAEIYTYEQKAIRVAPLNFEKIFVGNDNFSASFGYESFSASCKRDLHNEPKWISTSDQKKGDFKKVYEFVKANKDMLSASDVTLSSFMSLISQHTKVRGHYYCAMD